MLPYNGIIWTNGSNYLPAFSEMTGKLLWSSPKLVAPSLGPPTTYSVGKTQYVSLLDAATGDLCAFSYTK